MPDTPPLLREDHDHLRILRLNRPEAKNALTGELIQAVTDEFRAAADDDDVRAVLLTGNGTAFCAGLDLEAAAAPATSSAATAADEGESVGYDAVDNMAMVMRVECTKPIVAAVNGAAVGMGMSLAMAADIRIASPRARFHPGYARVGTSPDGGATWTVTQALGYERAMRFFLESRMVAADEALRIGLVSEVAETEEAFAERAEAYARQLSTVAPIAARHTKQLVGRAVELPDLAGHLNDEIRLALLGLASDDARRALEAFFTGSTPEFTGT